MRRVVMAILIISLIPCEGLMAAQSRFERCALFVCDVANIERGLHSTEHIIRDPNLHKDFVKTALGHGLRLAASLLPGQTLSGFPRSA